MQPMMASCVARAVAPSQVSPHPARTARPRRQAGMIRPRWSSRISIMVRRDSCQRSRGAAPSRPGTALKRRLPHRTSVETSAPWPPRHHGHHHTRSHGDHREQSRKLRGRRAQRGAPEWTAVALAVLVLTPIIIIHDAGPPNPPLDSFIECAVTGKRGRTNSDTCSGAKAVR